MRKFIFASVDKTRPSTLQSIGRTYPLSLISSNVGNFFSGGEFLNTVLHRNSGNQNGSRFLVFMIIYRAMTVHFIAQ